MSKKYVVSLALAMAGAVSICDAGAQNANTAADLWQRTTLYRDEWGVPHVYADAPFTLAFAFGYAQAEDNIAAMLRAYRIANGRASEVWGESTARSDEFAIAVGHAELAAKVYPQLDATTIQLCEGFAAGVNAWLVDNQALAPEWAEAVRPVDVLALLHCYLLSNAPFDYPEPAPMPTPSPTGNAWAVAPDRTTDGKTLLAINPHGFFDGPFRWYEAHLSMPGLNAEGATICGLPMLLVGHNDFLGWCLTPNQPDFADVVIEPERVPPRRNPAQINRNRLVETISLYESLLDNVRVYRVLTPNGMQPREAFHLVTERGPIVSRGNGRLYSWRAGGFGDFGGLLQLANMAAARDLEQFQASLTMQQLPSFNVIYGDREGNILYLYNVKTGDKNTILPFNEQKPNASAAPDANRINWKAPVSGDKREYAWGAIVPVSFLPSVVNPKSNYLQACGSPPWLATEDSEIKSDQWPIWLAGDRDTYRAKRVRALLGSQDWSFDDMQALVYDSVVPLAAEVVPKIIEDSQKFPQILNAHLDIPVGIDILRDWNFLAEADSEAMTFFHAWWTAMKALSTGRFRDQDALLDAIHADGEGMRELEFRAIAEAAKALRNEFQTVNVPWGEAHRIRRGELSMPAAGAFSGEPVFVMGDMEFRDKRWWSHYGFAFAMVVEFGDTPRAVSVVPFGASENPLSAHFADQLPLFTERRFKYTHFELDDVQRNAESARGRILNLQSRDGSVAFLIRTPRPLLAKLADTSISPSSLPSDMAAFSRFVTPTVSPDDVPVDISLEFRIAPETCEPENLSKLTIYAYSDSSGWAPLEPQKLSIERAAISGESRSAATYAVLGPANARVLRLAKANDVVVPKPADSVTEHKAEPSQPEELETPRDDANLLRKLFVRSNTTDARTKSFDVHPQTAEEIATEKEAAAPKQPSKKGPDIPDDVRASVMSSKGVFRTTASSEQTADAGLGRLKAQMVDGKLVLGTADSIPADGITSLAPPPPAEDAARENVTPSPEPAAPVRPPGGFEIVAVEPKAAGPVAWGRTVDVIAPGVGSFSIECSVTIQARAVIYDSPPSPLPPGMSAFTYFVQPETSPAEIPAEAGITLRVSPDAVSEENASKLAIYAFSKSRGWVPIKGSKADAPERIYSAIDSSLRFYAVLGPTDVQLKKLPPIKK
jgi:acyl-homoserine-lactone acylase